MNKVWMIGYIATEPESRTLDSGTRTSSFRIAVQRDYANSTGVRESDFFTVVTWRQLADFVWKYLHKGRKVSVCGNLQNRTYTAQDGSTRNVTEIRAESIEFADSKPTANEAPASASAAAPASQKTEMEKQGFKQVEDDELPL